MIIDKTQGVLDEVRKFAILIGKSDNLESCLSGLDYHNDDYKVSIYTDFAPKSFYFVRERNDKFAGNGGIIFHGHHDNGGDGSSPTLSVSLSNNSEPHWEIHT